MRKSAPPLLSPDFLDFSVEDYQQERVRMFAEEHHVVDQQVAAECVLTTLAIESALAQIVANLGLPLSAISYRDVRFNWADGIKADPNQQYRISIGGRGGLSLRRMKFNDTVVSGHDGDDRLVFSVKVTFCLVFRPSLS